MTLPGFHDYTAGDTLTAAQVDGVHRQTIMYFATEAARNSALSGVLEEGLHAYTADTDTMWYYTGSAWAGRASNWVNFTPAWANLTIGSATNVGRWCYTPSGFRCRVAVTFAGDTSIGGAVSMTLPNSFTSKNDGAPSYGTAVYYDDSATTRNLGVAGVGANATSMIFFAASGARLDVATVFTWATSDLIEVDIIVAL